MNDGLSLIGRCNCIMAAHCSPTKAGCRLKAGGTVNAGGGVCGPKDEEKYVPASQLAGAVKALERIRDHANSGDDPALLAQHELDLRAKDARDAGEASMQAAFWRARVIAALRHQLAGAVEERERLREVLRAVLMESDPIKRNQLAAPVLTNPGRQ